jgi:hypothetical protein
VPARVLRRRPDIRTAERRLAAQTAEVGVATAALYPSLSLSGSITLQALTASDVPNGFRTDRLGLSLNLPIFRGGALRQNLHAQSALVDQALAAYEATVLAAYEEVENALSASTNEHLACPKLGVESARRRSHSRNTTRTRGFPDRAQRRPSAHHARFARRERRRSGNLVRLYKALGGWSIFPKE